MAYVLRALQRVTQTSQFGAQNPKFEVDAEFKLIV